MASSSSSALQPSPRSSRHVASSPLAATRPINEKDWQIVLRQPSGTLVLHDAISNEVSAVRQSIADTDAASDDAIEEIPRSSSSAVARRRRQPDFCPFCKQAYRAQSRATLKAPAAVKSLVRTMADGAYFRLLSRTSTPQASRPSSRPSSPPPLSDVMSSLSEPQRWTKTERGGGEGAAHMPRDSLIDGYYERFFVEEKKLGRGQKGSVFLCRHVLDSNDLGHFAVKKIAVGQSRPELLKVLREIKFLEALRHRNVTQYHHAWIENASLTSFGPEVPVLFVLMDYANAGSLDGFIRSRMGQTGQQETLGRQSDDNEETRRAKRKSQFRLRMSRPQPLSDVDNSPRMNESCLPIHLLNLDEILCLFEDTCRGLAFLHSKGILHHDLKTENVLLNWDDDICLVPRAIISDFGSSMASTENWQRNRSGHTGTLDWVPPESLNINPRTGKLSEVGQKGDVWQIGLILHMLCFFRLPYKESEDVDKLIDEIKAYGGFSLSDLKRTDLPPTLTRLLLQLLHVDPKQRPACEVILNVLVAIRENQTTTVDDSGSVDDLTAEDGALIQISTTLLPSSTSTIKVNSNSMPQSNPSNSKLRVRQLLFACWILAKVKEHFLYFFLSFPITDFQEFDIP